MDWSRVNYERQAGGAPKKNPAEAGLVFDGADLDDAARGAYF